MWDQSWNWLPLVGGIFTCIYSAKHNFRVSKLSEMEATKPSLSHKPFLKKSRTHPTLKKCHKPKQVPYWQLCNDLICGPEPAVDQLWEELRLVAPIKVALASRRPEKRHLFKKKSRSCVKGLPSYLIFTFLSMKPLTHSYSWRVSNETRSMQRFLQ